MSIRITPDNNENKKMNNPHKQTRYNNQINPRYQKMILDLINHYIPRGKVICFGSRATGNARHGSDIDITIDAGKKITDGSIEQLRLALEEDLSIPITVDLSDFYDLPESFQKTIKEKGIVWRS